MMQAFQWDPTFVTGLVEVDEEHHHLTDLINRFGNSITQPEGVNHSELETIFSELADYTQRHFTHEEALMVSKRLLPAYIAFHRQIHDTFMDEIALLYRHIKKQRLDTSQNLFTFLTHWITFHTLGEDHRMARQVFAIESGVTPEEAYRNSGDSHDPATSMLLTALNGLFSMVSQRNQELLELNANLEARVAERTQALQQANQRLDTLANTDLLTNLPNRRRALSILAHEWTLSQHHAAPLACMMLDADGFKCVNDTYGHDAGDTVLQSLAQCLQHAVRNDDVVCRLGGDEFLIICAQTPLPGALLLAQKVLHEVNQLVVPVKAGVWRGRVSIGVAVRIESMNHMEDLIKKADESLYAAKQSGRNRVSSMEEHED
jgi:hemerythrin